VKKLIALVAVVGVGAIALPAEGAKTYRVKVDDNFFSPKTIRAKKGDRIRFTWAGSAPHNVRGAGISIGTRTSGSKTVRVRRAGKFVCTIHPGMEGRIRLR
jgi:plastocyanin